MTKCNNTIMNVTGFLHIFSILFAIFGTYKQISDLYDEKPYSPWLSISITIMLLFRIPSQICVSMNEKHGWITVIGTIIGAIGYGVVSFLTFKKYND